VDSAGLLLAVVVTAASVQDRDAARPLLWNLHRAHRRIRLIWADSVYNGKTLPASHEAMILWAMVALMARRLAQPAQLSNALRVSSI
jgi:hypothetical protein